MPGHSAALIWQIIKNRVIQKIIPSLGKKSNAQTYFAVGMVLLSILATVGFGIYVDGYVIHPPAQYTGICPAPARITGNQCLLTEIETVNQGTTTTVTTVQIPAGTIQYSTGTTVSR